MLLILDNLINNYLHILSCFIILLIFVLNKNKFILLFIIDILLNEMPVISIIILLLYFINCFLFSKIIKNKITIFILSCLYMFIFLSFFYLLNNYNYSYLHYLKSNIISIIFNCFIYYILIFYNNYLKNNLFII